jgi:hypothetical protein
MLARLKQFLFAPNEGQVTVRDELAAQRDALAAMTADIESLQAELRSGNAALVTLEEKEMRFSEELETVLLELHDGALFPILEHDPFHVHGDALSRISAPLQSAASDEDTAALEGQREGGPAVVVVRVAEQEPSDETPMIARKAHGEDRCAREMATTQPRKVYRLFELQRGDFPGDVEHRAWLSYVDVWRRRDAISDHFRHHVLFNMRRQRAHLEGKLFQRHLDLLHLQELRRVSEAQLREAMGVVVADRLNDEGRRIPVAQMPLPGPAALSTSAVNR